MSCCICCRLVFVFAPFVMTVSFVVVVVVVVVVNIFQAESKEAGLLKQ